MKTTFFYIGASVDIIAWLIAIGFVIDDTLKGRTATNNPFMYKAILLMAMLVAVAFYLKHIKLVGAANALLWLPGIPIVGYGLMILMFIIFKPDMK